jgi:hypothetical protein
MKDPKATDAQMEVFGSADGWLSLRFDDKTEAYLVPASVYQKASQVIKQDMVPNTWVHLGEFFMVEP